MLNTNFTEKFCKEGLTFDDVLLIPAASEVLPNQVDVIYLADQEYQAQHPHHDSCHGYCYHSGYGDCHCPGRRYRCYS